jgi:predicted nucleic acid-binding protein
MQTIPDSNVILDLIYRQAPFFLWSKHWFENCSRQGAVIMNAVIFAETSASFVNFRDAVSALADLGARQEDIPPEAAYSAGRAHRLYRERGGVRERVLPDFLVGGHAAVKGYRILTRDAARYRSYFPTLDIIAPDTHP